MFGFCLLTFYSYRTESFDQFIRYYPVVTTLISINLIVFILINLGSFGNTIFETVVGVNFFIANGEWWRIVTPIIAHKHFSHFLFNSFSLFLFGPALEQMLGKYKFLFIYFLAGISANIVTFFIKPLDYAHLGASGAIFGLFGYYISIIVFNKQMMSQENRQLIGTITVMSLVMTFLQPNINITAHIFGFISGFLLGFFFNKRPTSYSTY